MEDGSYMIFKVKVAIKETVESIMFSTDGIFLENFTSCVFFHIDWERGLVWWDKILQDLMVALLIYWIHFWLVVLGFIFRIFGKIWFDAFIDNVLYIAEPMRLWLIWKSFKDASFSNQLRSKVLNISSTNYFFKFRWNDWTVSSILNALWYLCLLRAIGALLCYNPWSENNIWAKDIFNSGEAL